MINHITQARRRPFVETGVPGVTSSHMWGENGDGSDFIAFKAGRPLRFTTMKVGKRSLFCWARSASATLQLGQAMFTSGGT